MTISLTTPITGAAQTGFTSPVYYIVSDNAPDTNGKQFAVTSVGGTQANVTGHSVASPFTLTFVRPKVFKLVGQPNPTTGIIRAIPKNSYKLIIRKGVIPAVNQPPNVLLIDCSINVPAGADTYDANNVRAAISAFVGALSQISAGLGDTLITGLL